MKLIFIHSGDRKLKSFKSLEDLSNYLEELALKKYKKTFLKEDGKVFEYTLLRTNRNGTVKTYGIVLQKNKKFLGHVQIPMGLMRMPKENFTIKVDKSKYKNEEAKEIN